MPDANHQAQKEYPMINVIFLFPTSADSQMLDDFISKGLIPSLKKAKGVLSLKTNDGHIMSRKGPPPYSRIVEATFDTLENLMATAPEDGDAEKEQFDKLGGLMISYEVNALL
jgi:hypothetical protein